jgi:hypothetical protein
MEIIVWAIAGVVGAVALVAIVNAIECCVDA